MANVFLFFFVFSCCISFSFFFHPLPSFLITFFSIYIFTLSFFSFFFSFVGVSLFFYFISIFFVFRRFYLFSLSIFSCYLFCFLLSLYSVFLSFFFLPFFLRTNHAIRAWIGHFFPFFFFVFNSVAIFSVLLEIYCFSGWHFACPFIIIIIVVVVILYASFLWVQCPFNLCHKSPCFILWYENTRKEKVRWLTGRPRGVKAFCFLFWILGMIESSRTYYMLCLKFNTLNFNFEKLNSFFLLPTAMGCLL